MVDKIKFVLAIALLIAGIVGFNLLLGKAMILRVLVFLLGLVLAGVVAWFTTPGKMLAVFVQESLVEGRKVVWPDRKETVQTTLVVFGFAMVMALFMYLVDLGLEKIIYQWILGISKS